MIIPKIEPRQTTFSFGRILSSGLLLVVLLLTFFALAATLYRVKNVNRAPFIAGYDWAAHPNTLLVVYPIADACSSCNLSVLDWAQLGLKSDLDVLVIAARENSELKRMRSQIASSRLTILTGSNAATIKQFSKGDLIGGARIYNGRILARRTGGTPSAAFLKPIQKEVKHL